MIFLPREVFDIARSLSLSAKNTVLLKNKVFHNPENILKAVPLDTWGENYDLDSF